MMKRLKLIFITTALCMGLTLPVFAAETDAAVETQPANRVGVTVRTLGDVGFSSLCEAVCGESFEFVLSLGEDWALRGIEIFDSDKNPVDFEVIGIYKYSFVMPEGGVRILVRSEDRGVASRADGVYSLWKMVGKPYVNYIIPFKDVDPEADYAEAVRWAASVGLVTVCDFFRTDDPITREELAVIAYRFALNCSESDKFEFEMVGEDFSIDSVDRESISDWAYDAVCWNIDNGVMSEFSGASGYFKPQESLTRHELSEVVRNLSELVCAPLGTVFHD